MTQVKPPQATIDPKSRTVLFTQPHAFLVDQEQKVLVTFAAMKRIAAAILLNEGKAEEQTGDPTWVPGNPTNGTGQ